MTNYFLQTPSFLQSVEWEKLQDATDRKTWEIDGLLVIQHRLPFGLNYLYCPKPRAVDEKFFEKVQKIAVQERSLFLKIEPTCELRIKTNYEYQKSASLQPPKTVILDLRKTEEELFGKMHEKMRYNVHLAERKDVVVSNFQVSKFASSANSRVLPVGSKDICFQLNFQIFWELLGKTAKRDRFFMHEKRYYEELLKTRSSDFSNELFFAEYKDKILAAALINFYKPSVTATYLHGASTREDKEVMAPHLLQWHIIKEAKRGGFNYYDLWGIDEKKWPGLTRFKLGFGGEVIEYPSAIDIIYRPAWYKVYQLAKKLK